MDKEKQIINSWAANASNWISIIDSNGIESRRLVTNNAIVSTVMKDKPSSVLDIGCGEGWLAKELYEQGITVDGVDVIPGLIQAASKKNPGHFFTGSYQDIAAGKIIFPKLYDAVVINFALIGKGSTEELLASLPSLLVTGGKLFIQTLHPYSRKAINDYVSGWKGGSWDGLGDQFTMPYQWYFRTMEDWMDLLAASGFTEIVVTEIFHPVNKKPFSVIFQCSVRANKF